jgi:hypothetical protein
MGPSVARAALVLALALGGCASTAMSAADVHVPVLLGPIPCIGCVAETRQPASMPVARLEARDTAFMFFVPLAPNGWGSAGDDQTGISPDRLLFGTSCLADIQLSNIRARAWMFSLPIFFYAVDTSVRADATQVVVPGASCASP